MRKRREHLSYSKTCETWSYALRKWGEGEAVDGMINQILTKVRHAFVSKVPIIHYHVVFIVLRTI